MTSETAIWFPFWYESDQSISVDDVAAFDFFKEPPSYIESQGRRVFYHGDWHERCRHLYETKNIQILSISHPELGSIQSIDTQGLNYTFTMSNGRILMVEAEETPGLVYDHKGPILDWRIIVEVEFL